MNINMMLTEGYKESKVKFPCKVSRKFDGVPVLFYVENGILKHKTRQGKELQSIPHIIKMVETLRKHKFPKHEGFLCVGELMLFTRDFRGRTYEVPFKDISGKVRKQEPCLDLEYLIFEMHEDIDTEFTPVVSKSDEKVLKLRKVSQIVVNDQETLNEYIELLKSKDWEGIIIRHGNYYWDTERPKRSYNSMRVVKERTADLRVVGLEEAVSKDGKPHGRVGAFICEYKDTHIKVGAGKLTHIEAKDLWDNELFQYGRIIKVKYKKDDSYDALRQPTFQCFRDDKDEPNWDE